MWGCATEVRQREKKQFPTIALSLEDRFTQGCSGDTREHRIQYIGPNVPSLVTMPLTQRAQCLIMMTSPHISSIRSEKTGTRPGGRAQVGSQKPSEMAQLRPELTGMMGIAKFKVGWEIPWGCGALVCKRRGTQSLQLKRGLTSAEQ
jgi:hypothetical protein